MAPWFDTECHSLTRGGQVQNVDLGIDMLPFGGKKMVFIGDPAQMEPVMGELIYGGGTPGTEGMLKAIRACGARGR